MAHESGISRAENRISIVAVVSARKNQTRQGKKGTTKMRPTGGPLDRGGDDIRRLSVDVEEGQRVLSKEQNPTITHLGV